MATSGQHSVTENLQSARRAIVSLVAVTDTSPRFERLHIDMYRKASATRRAQIAVELSDAVRETALAGIRRRHPEYSEAEVRRSFLTLLYGQAKR